MSNSLRIGGINSGIDTEALVNAMTAATKSRINSNQRKVKKLEAQQTAYRDVISKLQAFQKKYFDVLNRNTFLKGTTIFNSYKASVYDSKTGASSTPNGITVSSGTNAAAGTYNVTLVSNASQSTLTAQSYGSEVKLEKENIVDGATYSFSIKVGDVSKNIVFTAVGDGDISALNEELKKAFGTGSNGGLVSVNEQGNFVSTEKKAMTVSGITQLTEGFKLNLTDVQSGYNTLYVYVGDEIKAVSFSTLNADYFSVMFDDEGNFITDTSELSEEELAEYNQKLDLFNQIATEAYNRYVNAEYQGWLTSAEEEDKDALFEEYYEYRLELQTEGYWQSYYNQKKLEAYNEADTEDSFEDWDWSANGGYSDAASMRDAAESGGDDELKEAFDAKYGDAMLDRTAFKNGAYSESAAYKQLRAEVSYDEFKNGFDAAGFYTDNNMLNAFSSLSFSGGVKVEYDPTTGVLNAYKTVGDEKENVKIGLTTAAGTTNSFGVSDQINGTTATVSLSTKLSELDGILFINGQAEININGVKITLKDSMTVSEVLSAVNNSEAGVTMSFSTLTNTFSLTSKDYGMDAKIELGDDYYAVLTVMGFDVQDGGASQFKAGSNLALDINGTLVETTSNSYTIDGTTISVASYAEVGTTFRVEVEKDTSQAVNAIKSFVEDYNKLIEEIYAMLKEKSAGYYFLTDADVEDMDLSDRQVEQWEKLANQGLLYNDSTISDVMTKLRNAMYSSVTGSNGKSFGIYNIQGNDGTYALKTTSDYKMNGMLEFDEQALIDALEKNPEDIINLFTGSGGLMEQLESVLNYAVKSSGAKESQGVLVQKAGLATGLSSLDNSIYDQIKRLNDIISTLQTRYEKQQDRYWNIFSAMETQFASLNSQANYISSMFS